MTLVGGGADVGGCVAGGGGSGVFVGGMGVNVAVGLGRGGAVVGVGVGVSVGVAVGVRVGVPVGVAVSVGVTVGVSVGVGVFVGEGVINSMLVCVGVLDGSGVVGKQTSSAGEGRKRITTTLIRRAEATPLMTSRSILCILDGMISVNATAAYAAPPMSNAIRATIASLKLYSIKQ